MVLVFYPKDNTPVCTQQLCALRDDWSKFQERKVSVLGINPAGKDSHAAFASKHGFPFPVLVDQDSRIAVAFGAGGMLFTKRTVGEGRLDGSQPSERMYDRCPHTL